MPQSLPLMVLTLLMVSCVHPKVVIEADVDPRFDFKKEKGSKIFIALKDKTIEEKKFAYFLYQELEQRGYVITADDQAADYHLIYALDLETYKTKEYILRTNPEMITGTIDGQFFTAQRNAYRYQPVIKAYAYKELYLDLYVPRKTTPEKVWSGMLKIENNDYRKYAQSCVTALVDAIGKDVSKKMRLD